MEINPSSYWNEKYLKSKSTDSEQTKRLAQIIIKNIRFLSKLPSSILNVGCESGEMTHLLSFYFPFVHVYGCASSKAVIERCKERFPHLSSQFFVADIYNLSKIKKKFDLVVCSNVLEHLEEPQKALAELIKVAKEYVLVLVPVKEPIREDGISVNEYFFTRRGFSVHKDFTINLNEDGVQIVAILDKKNLGNAYKTNLNILIASPVRQDPEILKAFLNSLSELDIEGMSVSFLFIDNNETEVSKKLLQDFAKKHHPTLIWPTPPLAAFHCDECHHWEDDIIWRVAAFKNAIIRYAVKMKYDFLFLIDSDLVLHPYTLRHLISRGKDIISSIFWTKWQGNGPNVPQIWFMDQYSVYKMNREEHLTDEEKIERMQHSLILLTKPGTYEVGGVGACTLLSAKALKRGVNFNEVYNIGLRGEDRHFCVRAISLGFQLFVDTFYPAFHIYRKSDLKKIGQYKKYCEESIKKNKPLNSIKIIELVEEDTEKKAEFYYKKGESLYEQGKVEEAILSFQAVLELDSSHSLAHNNLAFIYWMKKDIDKALYHLTKAMELAPDNRDIVWNCGQIMLGLGYVQHAYDVYKSYLQKHPDEVEMKRVVEELEKRVMAEA